MDYTDLGPAMSAADARNAKDECKQLRERIARVERELAVVVAYLVEQQKAPRQ